MKNEPTPEETGWPREEATETDSTEVESAEPEPPQAEPAESQSLAPCPTEAGLPEKVQHQNESDEQHPAAAPKTVHERRSTGYVGQLPHHIRDQIGIMIYDGVPYRKILDTIGEPVKHLNEDHLYNWKKYGYKKWLEAFLRSQDIKTTRDEAFALLKHNAGTTVQDAGRTVASAQLYELLVSFDPTAFADLLAQKPELYLRIITTLTRLSEGEASRSRHRAQSDAEAKSPSAHGDTDKKLVSAETLKDLARQTKLI